MTPHQIIWSLPLALGRQLEAMWWRIHYDRTGTRGMDVRSAHKFGTQRSVNRIDG